MPGEDPREFWNEVDLWIRQRDAKTADEKACVESAVYSRWTRRRAINSQAHAVTAAITRIENHFAEQKAAEVRDLIPQLASNPDIIVTQLMNSTCGCVFLLNEFAALNARLMTHYSFEISQRERALQLGGHRPNELFTNWVVMSFNKSYFGSLRGPGGYTAAELANGLIHDRPSDISTGEFERRLEPLTRDLPSLEAGHATLQKYIAEWIARITERKELVGYREQDEKTAAIGIAQTEVSHEGQTRARYITQSDRTMNAALRMVLALQQDRRKYGHPDLEDLPPADAPGADRNDEASLGNDEIPSTEPETNLPEPAATNPDPQASRPGSDPQAAVIPVHTRQTPSEAVTTQVVGPAVANKAELAQPGITSGTVVKLSEEDIAAIREHYRESVVRSQLNIDKWVENGPSGP